VPPKWLLQVFQPKFCVHFSCHNHLILLTQSTLSLLGEHKLWCTHHIILSYSPVITSFILKYSSQHSLLIHTLSVFFPQTGTPSYTPTLIREEVMILFSFVTKICGQLSAHSQNYYNYRIMTLCCFFSHLHYCGQVMTKTTIRLQYTVTNFPIISFSHLNLLCFLSGRYI